MFKKIYNKIYNRLYRISQRKFSLWYDDTDFWQDAMFFWLMLFFGSFTLVFIRGWIWLIIVIFSAVKFFFAACCYDFSVDRYMHTFYNAPREYFLKEI